MERILSDWKQEREHRPLLVQGSRQVGKTYSIMKFAKENYRDVISINFERDIDIRQQFMETIRPNDIINYLKLKFRDNQFDAKHTLIFFDEIQACPNALTSLKFFSQECTYDIIASGSLLGIAIANSTSFPVGYVKTVDMYPMDYEEFLLACSIEQAQIDFIKKAFITKTPFKQGIHETFSELFRQYIVCGGMPAVVKDFVEYKDISRLYSIQTQILRDYRDDMAKYALPNEKVKVRECFESIPNQLAKENKKFQYKLIQKGASSRHFEGSLQWLKEAGVTLPCYRVNCTQYPLSSYKELNVFKVYMFDTGLLVSCFDASLAASILTNESFVLKGAIYENIVAQILTSKHKNLFYFEPSSRSEIDFLLEDKTNIIPVEIKSSTNVTSKSLKAYIDNYKPTYAYKFSFNNLSVKENLICLPIYMLPFV